MEDKVTLCSIMLNEEQFLPQFLENVSGVFSDYIFIDGGSTDKSVQIVEEAGCKVHQIPFKMDFGMQKNNALELAKTKWRMFMDIDESLSMGLKVFFKIFKGENLPPSTILAFFRDNYMDGVVQDDFPLNFVMRLFDDTVRYEGVVHEMPQVESRTVARFFHGRLFHRKDSYRQFRANLIYDLIRRGVTELPPLDQGGFNENGRLRLVKLLPERKIEVLDEYLPGEVKNVGQKTMFS
ncbi:MAG: glycosyltransferase [Gammaproteobacteria bacterium]|nr:glycosyltransferase [Gammaproteobacteria bacterium]